MSKEPACTATTASTTYWFYWLSVSPFSIAPLLHVATTGNTYEIDTYIVSHRLSANVAQYWPRLPSRTTAG